MKVLLYGPLADACGHEVEVDALHGCSIGQLREQLSRTHPGAAREIGRSRAIIGSAVVGDDHRANAGDRVEFLPPVSGG